MSIFDQSYHVQPTVKDVSRAVARLDANAGNEHAREAADSLARNLAFQFSYHNGWGGRKNVTTRDVRAALIAHGATPFTVEMHARRIAGRIRADFSDGRA